jgi:hypothetical protein
LYFLVIEALSQIRYSMPMSGKKKRRAPLIIAIFLFIVIGIPLIAVGISFIGRIAPDSVIPDSFDIFASVPDPVRLAARVLSHENLNEILALAELAPLVSDLNQLKETGLAENKFLRFAARGRLDAAFFEDERLLAAWDAGALSPLIKFLPLLAGRLTIPGLYYVNAGRNSRFEYRLEDGSVFYIGPHKNLLVISNNSSLYESVVSGSSGKGGFFSSSAKKFYNGDYDIAFLLSPKALANILRDSDPQLKSAVNLLQFPGPVEAALSILPNELQLRLLTPLESGSQALQTLIERNSQGAPLVAMVPDNTQYMTLLSAGNLKELLGAVSAISANAPSGPNWENTLRIADSGARMAVGMNLEELLYSWSGSQFAVYGLEGRPSPVIAIEVRDEKKRKEVFDKAFRSIFLNENIRLTLDGSRIPQIETPTFLTSLLTLMNINIPSPYYMVHDNYLFISESAETLLEAINAVRRNEVLPKQELWRALSQDNSGPSSFTLYYSLERSLPFFLKGQGAVTAVLKSYRHGLARLRFENKVLNVSLFTISGTGHGLVSVPGYPLNLPQLSANERTGKLLYTVSAGKDTRLLLSRGNTVLAVNPIEGSVKEFTLSGSPGLGVFVVPAEAGNYGEGIAWIANSQGSVCLVNKDMESLKGFPVSTGIKLSADPVSYGGKLFLPSEDGSVHTVDSKASVSRWGNGFYSPLRSPPSFIDFKNKTYAAVYPKSFFGEIFLLDASGIPQKSWPVPVSGIAFGTPELFITQYPDKTSRLFTAFITQAGELSIYTEDAQVLPAFPLELEGVFYLQPVFDGEYLWVIESAGTLYRIGLDGEVVSRNIPRLSVKEDGHITVAAIGKDKKIGVFFSGDGNALHGYFSNFSPVEDFPLPVWGRPVFGDLNADGKIEAAGIGMDNKLYMWQFK